MNIPALAIAIAGGVAVFATVMVYHYLREQKRARGVLRGGSVIRSWNSGA